MILSFNFEMRTRTHIGNRPDIGFLKDGYRGNEKVGLHLFYENAVFASEGCSAPAVGAANVETTKKVNEHEVK